VVDPDAHHGVVEPFRVRSGCIGAHLADTERDSHATCRVRQPGPVPVPVLPDVPIESCAEYEARGGGQGIARARRMGPEETIREVERSGLRGRGGGGFPTGRKWRSVRDSPGTHRYVVANGAEGEPGTYKDRAIMRRDPYQLIEGIAIAAYAIGTTEAYIGVKASFTAELERLERAAQEMTDANHLGDLTLTIARGPDEYLFGEETALLEVIEGGEPLPRVLRPYEHGLFASSPQLGWQSHEETGHTHPHDSNPTLVNNVESLAHATWVLANGADDFRSQGTGASPGAMVFTLSGDVARPGVYERPLGTPVETLISECAGGTANGRPVKMVMSGVANPVLVAEALGTPADFDSLPAAGGGLGSGGFVIYDDQICTVAVAHEYSRFLYVESCGQCPPCKLQSGRITSALEALRGEEVPEQLDIMRRALATVADGNRCYLPIQEQQVVASLLQAFPDDVDAHEAGTCPLRHDVVVPKIVDLTPEGFVFDTNHLRKQPDWSYAPA
jgi:NADH-quinone oxidoreductase subunit F